MFKPAQERVHPGALMLAACMCMFAITSAYAQVFRCTDADGHTVFSGTPCGSTSEKVEVVDSSAGVSQASSDGLSKTERNALEADVVAAEAQRSTVGEHGADNPGSYTSTAASARQRNY
jgi:hypothetical protein